MEEFMIFLGELSNAVAAVSAVVAILVTIKNYNRDKEEHNKAQVTEKKAILYKEGVIDAWLQDTSRDISNINRQIINLSLKNEVSSNTMYDLYNQIKWHSKMWLYEVEIIKVFDEILWAKTKLEIERLFDTYSLFIVDSIKKGQIEEDFQVEINKELSLIRRRLFEKYLEIV